MSYEELIKAFAEKLGGAVDLSPDADGTVMLDVDGLELTIMGMEEIGQVALIGIIGVPPPEEKMERLYRAMLEANHNFAGTSGATLSINPDTGKVSLCKILPLALADGDGFFKEIERFVNTLETWHKLVEDFRGVVDEPAAAPSEMTFGGGFMQV